MDKSEIVALVVAHLEKEVEAIRIAAQKSFEDATAEENKAENKYDTRSLEASYLAGGQAKMAAEAHESLSRFRSLEIKDFEEDDPVALSALIKTINKGYTDYYFLGPSSGGLEVKVDETLVMIITPQSPIGKALLGKQAGDDLELEMGRNKVSLKVTEVS